MPPSPLGLQPLVLLVTGDLEIRSMLVSALEALECQVIAVACMGELQSFLDLTRSRPPKVVLLPGALFASRSEPATRVDLGGREATVISYDEARLRGEPGERTELVTLVRDSL